MRQHEAADNVVVAGGGLAGLTAATILARAGRAVTVFERAGEPGGRAVTHEDGGFRFNLGPHALYRLGEAARTLSQLGIKFNGGVPGNGGAYAIKDGRKHALPGGFFSLVTTGLFGLPAKLDALRLFGSVQKIDPAPLEAVSVRRWSESVLRTPEARALLLALVRLSTYAGDAERMSAGAALAQLQLALRGNVYYLDGGWQTLVDGLRAAAEAAGAVIRTGARVEQVVCDSAVRGVRLADGSVHEGAHAILAVPPAAAAALIPDDARGALRRWAEEAIPVRAACLDVGLSRLPRPKGRFALGIDRPLYLSVHSAVARLAPEGGATVQVAKYLASDVATDVVTSAKADEQELEALLDLAQPGWRELVVTRRYLPRMAVSNWLVTARGGLAGRPTSRVPGIAGLHVAGDWVGARGMLADAAVASAAEAAELILRNDAASARAA